MGPYIFLDLETTGHDPEKHKIIEIGALRWEDGKIVDRLEQLVNPGVPIPYEIELLTGITNHAVAASPAFSEIKDACSAFIGDAVIVGHNISFDTSFLRSHHLRMINLELDTCALARILLANESSYALEVLMKKYGLPTRSSHRAMADVETTLDFFFFLLGKIGEIPESLKEKIRPILEKTQWVGGELFRDEGRGAENERRGAKLSGGETAIPNFPVIPAKAGIPRADRRLWSPEATKRLMEDGITLIESDGIPDFASLKKQQLLIAYTKHDTYHQLQCSAEAARLSTSLLNSPSYYLSPMQLQKVCDRQEITEIGAQFLLKILLWEAKTETGSRAELSLAREEYGLFDMIADHGGCDQYWKKALEQSQKSDVVFLHHGALAEGIATYFADRRLIISDAGALENALTHALTRYYTVARLVPYFRERADLFLGLVGIFYIKYGDQGESDNLFVDEHLKETIHWKRICEAAAHLPESQKRNEIVAALNSGNLIWISSYQNEISLNMAPVDIGGSLQEIVRKHPSAAFLDHTLFFSNAYIEKILKVPQDAIRIRETESSATPANIIPVANLPEPYSEKYFDQLLAMLKRLIEEHRGRMLFLMSSRKNVQAVHEALIAFAEGKKVKLRSVGMSGGAGKSCALFTQNPDTSILMGTPTILPHLGEISELLDVIVFQKIPFDPPFNPIPAARAKLFDRAFDEYTVPRAYYHFRDIVHQLCRNIDQKKRQKQVYILDSRVFTKDWGKIFI